MSTTQEISVCLQKVQQKTIKLEILDLNENVIDEISGLCIDGSLSIDGQSAIRRTCDLKFILNSKTMISETSSLWINKRFKLWLGIIDISTGDEILFLVGTYIINDPTVDIQINERTVSIKGMDKMCLISGELSGQLSAKTIIPVNTSISTAIKTTITDLGGETKYLIDTSPYNTPYQIEQDIGGSVYDVLKELADLYMLYKIYYDRESIFRFTKIKDGLNSPINFDFSSVNIIQSIQSNPLYSNVKNYYKIIGRLNSDGTQPTSELTIANSNYPNSPFTVEKMGSTRKYVEQKDTLYTQAQVTDYINYCVYKHLTLSESVSFTCLPLPFLDVDMLVNIDFTDEGITGVYMIDSINLSLAFDGLMNITCHKIY